MAAVEVEVRRSLVGNYGVEVVELWWADEEHEGFRYAEIGYGIFEMEPAQWILWANDTSHPVAIYAVAGKPKVRP